MYLKVSAQEVFPEGVFNKIENFGKQPAAELSRIKKLVKIAQESYTHYILFMGVFGAALGVTALFASRQQSGSEPSKCTVRSKHYFCSIACSYRLVAETDAPGLAESWPLPERNQSLLK